MREQLLTDRNLYARLKNVSSGLSDSNPVDQPVSDCSVEAKLENAKKSMLQFDLVIRPTYLRLNFRDAGGIWANLVSFLPWGCMACVEAEKIMAIRPSISKGRQIVRLGIREQDLQAISTNAIRRRGSAVRKRTNESQNAKTRRLIQCRTDYSKSGCPGLNTSSRRGPAPVA